MKCDGGCDECTGNIRKVRVRGFGHEDCWEYCEGAVEEDKRRGFDVHDIDALFEYNLGDMDTKEWVEKYLDDILEALSFKRNHSCTRTICEMITNGEKRLNK